MRDFFRRLWASWHHRDFYIGSDGFTHAARNIDEGESVTFTLDELHRMKR